MHTGIIKAALKLKTLPELPTVSIVIPARNEESFIGQCVESIRRLDYPRDRLEIIVADSCSRDRTAEIARSMGCSVVDNPGRTALTGRNAGFAVAQGDIIAFTDADCKTDPAWIRNALRHFKTTGAGGLSGPTEVPCDQNPFGQAVGIVFSLAGLAGGTVHHGHVEKAYETDDLPGCNALYRREALAAVMPLPPGLISNEDVELNAALLREGFKLLMTPDVRVLHYKRSTPLRFWRQMHTFAMGRAQLSNRYPSILRPIHWLVGAGIPLAALAFATLFVVIPALRVTLAAASLAGLLALWFHGWRCASARAGLNLMAAALIFAAAWPSGFLRGFIQPLNSGGPAQRRDS